MQFCKTSSVFELNLTTSKREHFCETSFKNGKLSADLMASYQRVLRFSRKKVPPSHTTGCNCHPKIIWCSKMQPLSGNQLPDLLTCLMEVSLVLRLPATSIFVDPLQTSRTCHQLQNPHLWLTFDQGTESQAPGKMAWTSNSAPNVVLWRVSCFEHVHIEMCFAPQWRALFRHLNFQKCFARLVF